MPHPIKDCSCEDFPCCVHADNYPSEGMDENDYADWLSDQDDCDDFDEDDEDQVAVWGEPSGDFAYNG